MCATAMKRLACSVYFPRCESDGLYAKIFGACGSLCRWVHELKCPGSEHLDCTSRRCCENDPQICFVRAPPLRPAVPTTQPPPSPNTTRLVLTRLARPSRRTTTPGARCTGRRCRRRRRPARPCAPRTTRSARTASLLGASSSRAAGAWSSATTTRCAIGSVMSAAAPKPSARTRVLPRPPRATRTPTATAARAPAAPSSRASAATSAWWAGAPRLAPDTPRHLAPPPRPWRATAGSTLRVAGTAQSPPTSATLLARAPRRNEVGAGPARGREPLAWLHREPPWGALAPAIASTIALGCRPLLRARGSSAVAERANVERLCIVPCEAWCEDVECGGD